MWGLRIDVACGGSSWPLSCQCGRVLALHCLACGEPSTPRYMNQALSFRLSRLDVHDLFTQGVVFPHMLKVGGHDDGVDNDTPALRKARAKVCWTQYVRRTSSEDLGQTT